VNSEKLHTKPGQNPKPRPKPLEGITKVLLSRALAMTTPEWGRAGFWAKGPIASLGLSPRRRFRKPFQEGVNLDAGHNRCGSKPATVGSPLNG